MVKALAITLVVFGHCIQYGSGREFLVAKRFFSDPVFTFIYSFHMPLFMLVSGYLFAFSVKKARGVEHFQVLWKKARQLVVPLFFWGGVSASVPVCTALIQKGCFHIVPSTFAKTWFLSFVDRLWFLWAIWWCLVIVIMARSFFRDSFLFYLAVLLVTFVTPDSHGFGCIKFVYPYFVFGYSFHAHGVGAKWVEMFTNRYFGVVSGICFVAMLCFFGRETYIYTSRYSLIGKPFGIQLWNDSFRFLIGLFGSLFVMRVIWSLEKRVGGTVRAAISYVGRNTLGLYVIPQLLLHKELVRLSRGLTGVNYAVTTAETIVLMGVALVIQWALKKNRLTNILFLGGR